MWEYWTGKLKDEKIHAAERRERDDHARHSIRHWSSGLLED